MLAWYAGYLAQQGIKDGAFKREHTLGAANRKY
jgi:hypothetical protein